LLSRCRGAREIEGESREDGGLTVVCGSTGLGKIRIVEVNRKSTRRLEGNQTIAAVLRVVPRGPRELGPNGRMRCVSHHHKKGAGPALTGLRLGPFYGWLCARSLIIMLGVPKVPELIDAGGERHRVAGWKEDGGR
jgi:hypothetical protein